MISVKFNIVVVLSYIKKIFINLIMNEINTANTIVIAFFQLMR